MKWAIDSETNRDGLTHARLLLDGQPTGMAFGNTAEMAHLRTVLGLDPEAVTALEEERHALQVDLDEHRASVAQLLDKVKVLEKRNREAGEQLRAWAAQIEAGVAAEEARLPAGAMTREECAAVLSPLYPGDGIGASEPEARDGHACAAAQHARDVARLRWAELDGWDLFQVFNGKATTERKPMLDDWIWHRMARLARDRLIAALGAPTVELVPKEELDGARAELTAIDTVVRQHLIRRPRADSTLSRVDALCEDGVATLENAIEQTRRAERAEATAEGNRLAIDNAKKDLRKALGWTDGFRFRELVDEACRRLQEIHAAKRQRDAALVARDELARAVAAAVETAKGAP